ncbi:putative pectin methylesterase [Mycena maculata]|uniref:Pectin methylesterase n=1 Tax=Mycena maculata TaxID=230809 RepID=A0AAD7NQU2_9AGAR|nr:putative pectin methylesterase [Mycena maculata]
MSRTTRPAGPVIVGDGDFSTIQSAVNTLPNEGSAQIYGCTTSTAARTWSPSPTWNRLQLLGATSQLQLRKISKDDFVLYNVKVKNTLGIGSQGLDLAAYGTNQVGFYGGSHHCGWNDFSLFVITESNLIVASTATSSLAGQGRLHVVRYEAHINVADWEIRSTATPNTADVLFPEFGSPGAGAGAAGTRVSFSKLTSNPYTVARVLGSSWTTWVDSAYA